MSKKLAASLTFFVRLTSAEDAVKLPQCLLSGGTLCYCYYQDILRQTPLGIAFYFQIRGWPCNIERLIQRWISLLRFACCI